MWQILRQPELQWPVLPSQCETCGSARFRLYLPAEQQLQPAMTLAGRRQLSLIPVPVSAEAHQ